MRITTTASLLWALVLLLLTGTVAVSLTASSLTGRDPPLGVLALGGALIGVVVLALVLERPRPAAAGREQGLPESAYQDLVRILRDSPFIHPPVRGELLYGTPEAFQAALPQADIPLVALSSLIHAAAQRDPPVLRQILDNAVGFMGADHPRTRDIARWRKTWSV